ncbi:unnamed protein product [Cuscuta campestris]|uniref:Uncharacterized protein n=1 Tax=Cuscuta campestris TaxID=132261 RepID=A0A484LDA6_9ASTE|nr:unnamed protein product [Cuscuta campestris]
MDGMFPMRSSLNTKDESFLNLKINKIGSRLIPIVPIRSTTKDRIKLNIDSNVFTRIHKMLRVLEDEKGHF